MRGGTVFRTVGTLVFILLLVPFIIFAVPQVIGAEQSYVVVSSSMSPTIDAGAAVIVNNVSPQAISVGDVITFRTGTGKESAVVTHRVVNVTERNGTRLFRTQGDANAQPDPGLVSPEELVGRVTLVIPYLGQAIAFVQSDAGLILLVGVPISLLILGKLWDLEKAYQTSRQADDDSVPASSSPWQTAANNEPSTDSDESQEGSLISFVKRRPDQSELIDSNERDSLEEWSFGTGGESSEQSPAEQSAESPEQSTENQTSFPTHRLMAYRPPEELTTSQIVGELQDIERLSDGKQREYEQEGYDIEQRRRELIAEANERFATLEELQTKFESAVSSTSEKELIDGGVEGPSKELRNSVDNLLSDGQQCIEQISWGASKSKVMRLGVLAVSIGGISALSAYWLGFVFLAPAVFFIIIMLSMDHLVVYPERE